MKQYINILLFLLTTSTSFSQVTNESVDTPWKKNYRAFATKINALEHTKLEVRFDYAKSYLYGKEWLTLRPYFYKTDSLTLDAKGMDIHAVSIVKGNSKSPLKYSYDSLLLKIHLDKTYTSTESYTIYIDYTSKPDEQKASGSVAISDAKGLYFINPLGKENDKPTQIWTQGETESNSVWMPTIDKPNQKSTEEIYMTVPAKYVTLSNGLLISQKKNADGTRTDYWKMDLPHAPYLFFMGVGDYAIVKDHYKQKEVAYYVEKKYESVARRIFGYTPEMIQFFSQKLNYEFPWPKYNQIVGRDFVSGAMENTTCTLHQESAYQNDRQLTDGNIWEETIAHELFHQWFGDLVTTESWSNITVNESFANYSEVLWDEFKHGKDFGDEHNFDVMAGYLRSGSEYKNLVRFYYADKEDVFDAVSYNKGCRILTMLRNYVGDDAFFKSLNNYLTTNKFKTGSADKLRLAFEEVTGRDLNWFWNQWYYGSGQPKLDITYKYDAAEGKEYVFVKQTQETGKLFLLPVAIDVYTGKNKERYNVWINNETDTFSFKSATEPDLVNVDADKILLCEKVDHKTKANFVFQFLHAPNYMDRREALEYFNANKYAELILGLQDKFPGLRRWTINQLNNPAYISDPSVISKIEKVAIDEKDKKTKASALNLLAGLNDKNFLPLFNKNVNDSSYSVSGAALKGINNLDPNQGYQLAKKYSKDAKGELFDEAFKSLVKSGDENDFDFVASSYDNTQASKEKIDLTKEFCNFLCKVNDLDKVKKGIDYVIKFRNQIPEQYRIYTDSPIKKALDNVTKCKGKVIDDYIQSNFK